MVPELFDAAKTRAAAHGALQARVEDFGGLEDLLLEVLVVGLQRFGPRVHVGGERDVLGLFQNVLEEERRHRKVRAAHGARRTPAKVVAELLQAQRRGHEH